MKRGNGANGGNASVLGSRNGNGNKNGSQAGSGKKKKERRLTPQQLAVVVGLLTNSLDVLSVLIDKDQRIEIVLEGSIRRKTEADRVAEELENISVAELIEALIRRG
ncbi:hypothetical protein [Paenibacillus sp. RC84]|uniref:hypothetical protein n=1 Tax=Paenibacillus sp. RC84 TaxID=3156252 RepID=UPI003510EDCE